MNPVMRHFLWALILGAGLLLPGCFNSAFYHPDRSPGKTPADYQLPFEEVFFNSGERPGLHGWFVPAIGSPAGTVVHFHGSYGNLSHAFRQVHWLPAEGFNVFAFDYRGYGRSKGTPSRCGVYEDSVAALEYVLKKPGIDPANVFVFGQSLGGANAIAAVAKKGFPQIRAIAVEGTFYSYRTQARDAMTAATREKIGNIPFLSLQTGLVSFLTVTDSYSPGDYIRQLSPIPVLLIHCRQDAIVSHPHSVRLYTAAKEPRQLWLIDGCRHIAVFTEDQSPSGYRQRLVQFFRDHRQKAP